MQTRSDTVLARVLISPGRQQQVAHFAYRALPAPVAVIQSAVRVRRDAHPARDVSPAGPDLKIDDVVTNAGYVSN